MTTLLGIKGYDPNLEKEYILFASDSKWINKHQRKFGYDAKKIFSNVNKNLIIGHSGTLLFSKNNCFTEFEENLINNLISSEYKQVDEIFSDMKTLIEYNKIRFVFGIKGSTGLELYAYEKDYFIPFEKFIVSEKDKKFLKYFKIKNYKKSKSFTLCGMGTGGEIAFNKLDNELVLIPKKEDRSYIIPIEDLLNYTRISLIEAKEKDNFTGGNMNIGILTNEKTFVQKDFLNLDKNKSFEYSKEMAFNKLKKCFKNKYNSLDKLLLGIK